MAGPHAGAAGRGHGDRRRRYASAREAAYLRGRERGHWTFASCEFERLGLSSREDTEYIEPGVVHFWAFHQLLLDSGLSEDAARRYFLASLIATDITERAPGDVRLRDGRLIVDDHGERVSIRIDEHGKVDDASLEALYDVKGDGCRLYSLSVAPNEPMRNLRWHSPSSCVGEGDTFELAIDERELLLRPLRVELDLSGDTSNSETGLEIEVAASGSWKAKGKSGRAAELATLVEGERPEWVLLLVDPDTPARLAVDLARVVDVWRSRGRHDTTLLMKVK